MPYKRIISLVPSLTELVVDLGLADQIVGRTRFCIHPEECVKSIQIIGGTKNPNIEKIQDLKPDLVIANKEENRKEDVEMIRDFCEVVVTKIETVDHALFWIDELGSRVGKSDESNHLVEQIRNYLPQQSYSEPIPTAYFIWKDPWMSVGNDTYIHDVMQRFGLPNVFADRTRYPATSMDELVILKPKLILLSSEPYPFKEKHIQELKNELPESNIQLIDGEWFSWYGSRMLPTFKAIANWRMELSTF